MIGPGNESDTITEEKPIPSIQGDEDEPLSPPQSPTEGPEDTDLVESEEKPVPKIQGDEDEPLSPTPQLPTGRQKDTDLVETDDIGKEMARFRYKTGRTVLYVAMAAMGTFVLVDLFASHSNIKSDLITSAFEAFKLITMTVLGYFFASNNSNSN